MSAPLFFYRSKVYKFILCYNERNYFKPNLKRSLQGAIVCLIEQRGFMLTVRLYVNSWGKTVKRKIDINKW